MQKPNAPLDVSDVQVLQPQRLVPEMQDTTYQSLVPEMQMAPQGAMAVGGPTQMHTTLVINNQQQNQGPQFKRPWQTGLCSCATECCICILGWLCPCVLGCTVASSLQESCCVINCLQGGLMATRAKLRTQHNIEGTICSDWCVTCCCCQLALCQMARELKLLGLYR